MMVIIVIMVDYDGHYGQLRWSLWSIMMVIMVNYDGHYGHSGQL